MSGQVPLGIVGASGLSGSYICTLFSGSAQRDDAVVPFLAEGSRSGHECARMLEAPVGLDHPVGMGQLELPAPEDAFFRYESLRTAAISGLPGVVICLYDLERFGAEVPMDTLRTHPRVIVDGMIYDNPYYVEPGKFVAVPG